MDLQKWKAWKEAPQGPRKEKLIAELLHENRNLAIKFIQRVLYSASQKIEWDDAYQYGMIGLYEAFKRYDPTRGYGHFSTVAWLWVRKFVQDGLAEFPVIKRPVWTLKVTHRKFMEIESFRKKHNRDPQPSEVGLTQQDWDRWAATVIKWDNIKSHLRSTYNRPDENYETERMHHELGQVLETFNEKERAQLLNGRATEELMNELKERMLGVDEGDWLSGEFSYEFEHIKGRGVLRGSPSVNKVGKGLRARRDGRGKK